ncbi:inositol monophosphatase family protein [Allorhizobium taibaishanense]|uniref:Inositol-1-monophosphatase n=1 Tax=Allorhizobium taibaishanense TaxID=887144 RepID=A0A1Q9A6J9_9HYPH|nr:inositol monophosphatase family protein [Allorhizobium taibaishanense]MBB4008659.1 myo-inositol-1(or 4)-monophosphatase [Allorhizobium taibaishanense]OLP50207.1 inositol monophosphatase [Allorhizobium taibaishanense]
MTEVSARNRLGPDCSPRLVILAELALEAGAFARRSLRRRGTDQMVSKGPRDYQTEIDVAVERQIVDGLSAAFPDYAIQGEEEIGNRTAAPDKPVIFIDPIDGTTNFAWGLPHFGITIAIAEAGETVCGVVYDSMLDELFSAELDKGAYLNGERLQCSDVADIENVLVGAGLPVPGQVVSVDEELYHRALRRLMDNTAGVRRLGSAALSIAYVACGRLDGFFEDGLQVHDYGSAALVLTEAGGRVTGFHGEAVAGESAILAATPALQPWLLAGFKA